MKRFCLALDLKNDPKLIAEYEEHHKAVWPEVIQNIHASGISKMEIYRTGNRLFMIMETTDSFSFENKTMLESMEPRISDWENLMWKFQQALPTSKPGEKWVVMEKIFDL